MEIILVELCYRLTWYQAYYQLDLYTCVDPYYIVYNYRLLDKYIRMWCVLYCEVT